MLTAKNETTARKYKKSDVLKMIHSNRESLLQFVLALKKVATVAPYLTRLIPATCVPYDSIRVSLTTKHELTYPTEYDIHVRDRYGRAGNITLVVGREYNVEQVMVSGDVSAIGKLVERIVAAPRALISEIINNYYTLSVAYVRLLTGDSIYANDNLARYLLNDIIPRLEEASLEYTGELPVPDHNKVETIVRFFEEFPEIGRIYHANVFRSKYTHEYEKSDITIDAVTNRIAFYDVIDGYGGGRDEIVALVALNISSNNVSCHFFLNGIDFALVRFNIYAYSLVPIDVEIYCYDCIDRLPILTKYLRSFAERVGRMGVLMKGLLEKYLGSVGTATDRTIDKAETVSLVSERFNASKKRIYDAWKQYAVSDFKIPLPDGGFNIELRDDNYDIEATISSEYHMLYPGDVHVSALSKIRRVGKLGEDALFRLTTKVKFAGGSGITDIDHHVEVVDDAKLPDTYINYLLAPLRIFETPKTYSSFVSEFCSSVASLFNMKCVEATPHEWSGSWLLKV